MKPLPPSPLQLRQFWVDEFSFSAREEGGRTRRTKVLGDVRIYGRSGQSQVFVVMLLASDDADKRRAHDFSVRAIGTFDVPGGLDEERSREIVAMSSPTILYGVLRGYVASATNAAPRGPILLPAVEVAASIFNAPPVEELAEGESVSSLDL